MNRNSIVDKIREISQVLPCSPQEKERISDLAIEISRTYLESLPRDEERYIVDVALSSVYLSSNNVGCRFSYSEISKNSGYSLSSWPRIVKDIRAREK